MSQLVNGKSRSSLHCIGQTFFGDVLRQKVPKLLATRDVFLNSCAESLKSALNQDHIHPTHAILNCSSGKCN